VLSNSYCCLHTQYADNLRIFLHIYYSSYGDNTASTNDTNQRTCYCNLQTNAAYTDWKFYTAKPITVVQSSRFHVTQSHHASQHTKSQWRSHTWYLPINIVLVFTAANIKMATVVNKINEQGPKRSMSRVHSCLCLIVSFYCLKLRQQQHPAAPSTHSNHKIYTPF